VIANAEIFCCLLLIFVLMHFHAHSSMNHPFYCVGFSVQVEAAYDMLLMQSLTRRRTGKVINSSIRYADVKPVRSPGAGSLPQWLQTTVKNVPVSVEAPSSRDLGIQAGVYGALMVFTFASGASTSSVGAYTGADVPGLILATGFGASLYFLTKKSSSLGKQRNDLFSFLLNVCKSTVGLQLEKYMILCFQN